MARTPPDLPLAGSLPARTHPPRQNPFHRTKRRQRDPKQPAQPLLAKWRPTGAPPEGVYPSRSDRATRSGPVRQDTPTHNFLKKKSPQKSYLSVFHTNRN